MSQDEHEEPTLGLEWPRLGALAAIPGRDGAWSIWSQGTTPVTAQDRKWWRRSEPRKWWLIPVDATEAERADRAVLLHEREFGPYVPDETGALW